MGRDVQLLVWGGMLLVLALFVLAAPALAQRDPFAMDPENPLAPPSRAHWLGTDQFGRDLFSRLLWGGRRTLGMAGAAVLITVGAGLILGLVAGTYGRLLDALLMRLVDVMLAFPGVLLILGLVAVMGSGAATLAVAVGLAGVPVFTRVVRAAVMAVRDELYVEAAWAMGCTPGRIISRHILPNIVGPVTAFASVQFGWAILNASAMSFLGLGESASVPEWGSMLNLGRGYLRNAPWMSIAPGIAITLAVLSINNLGNVIQRRLDPMSRF